jgi:hypothetical protein
MSLLAAAIRRKDWQVVALYLILGYLEALRRRNEALQGLIEVAGGDDEHA